MSRAREERGAKNIEARQGKIFVRINLSDFGIVILSFRSFRSILDRK